MHRSGHDGEPEARAGPRLLRGEERIEHPLPVGLGHTGAVVRHVEQSPGGAGRQVEPAGPGEPVLPRVGRGPVARAECVPLRQTPGRGSDCDGAAGGRLRGVHHQVEHHLLQRVPLALHQLQGLVQVHQEPVVLEQPLRGQEVERGPDRLVQVGQPRRVGSGVPRLRTRPRIIQQSLHDPVDPGDGRVHLADHLRIAAPPAQHLGVSADGA